jgi:hypothetical protein
MLLMGVSVPVDDGRLLRVETEEHAEDLLVGVKEGGDAGGLRRGLGSRIAPRNQPQDALGARFSVFVPSLVSSRLVSSGIFTSVKRHPVTNKDVSPSKVVVRALRIMCNLPGLLVERRP